MDQLGVAQARFERFGAVGNFGARAKLLQAMIGAWGFETQTPTVSTLPRLTLLKSIGTFSKFRTAYTASTASTAGSAHFCVPKSVPTL